MLTLVRRRRVAVLATSDALILAAHAVVTSVTAVAVTVINLQASS